MANAENVIKAWNYCNPFNRKCKECPYEKDCYHDGISRHMVADAIELLKSQQAEIERLQPKKGHWEMKPDPFGLFDGIPVCSACGRTNDMRKKTEFCEHCGADMREGDGDGNHS